MSLERKIYSVSALTGHIKRTLEDEVGEVWVEGEISGFKVYASGHAYFTLKDNQAQLKAVLFNRARLALGTAHQLVDGKKIRAFGEITVFEKSGQYQLLVRRVEALGEGDLMARYLELKRRLEAEGLFAPELKRPLPRLPQRIGVVTSPSGAVIHDILNVLGRRYPNLQIRLAPVKVQGVGAAEEIAAAVELFNRTCGADSDWPADLLIVGRGGGSLEDLWAFNEEPVARAVAASVIPVISAVGHQTDNSLCDLAADVRAPTPSAAAELAIAPKEEFEALLERHGQRLRRTLRQQTQLAASRLVAAGASEFLRRPERILERFAQQLDNLGMRMASSMRQRAQSERRRLDHTSASLLLLRLRQINAIEVRLEDSLKRLTGAWRIQLERRRGRVENAQRHLALLSPLAVLERGYSLTRTADGRLVRTVDEVEPGAVLTTQIKDGLIKSRVE